MKADSASLVDELWVTLGIYGEELHPDEIARLLGVVPSDTVSRGDRDSRGWAWPHSAYLLQRRAETRDRVPQVVDELLDLLPDSEELWGSLKSSYRLRLLLAASTCRSYSGFELSPAQIGRLARMKVDIGVDFYVIRPDDDEASNVAAQRERKH